MKAPTPPKGFKLGIITLKNGIKKYIATSDKSWKSPKRWNGKAWFTDPQGVQVKSSELKLN